MKLVKFHLLLGEPVSVRVRSDAVVTRLTQDIHWVWSGDRGTLRIDWEDGHPPTYINAAQVQMVETEESS
jgi:hypothetical protein